MTEKKELVMAQAEGSGMLTDENHIKIELQMADIWAMEILSDMRKEMNSEAYKEKTDGYSCPIFWAQAYDDDSGYYQYLEPFFTESAAENYVKKHSNYYTNMRVYLKENIDNMELEFARAVLLNPKLMKVLAE